MKYIVFKIIGEILRKWTPLMATPQIYKKRA